MTNLELPQTRLQESLPLLDMTPGRDPDAGEGPHVLGSPGEEHLPVTALQEHHHANVHSALDRGGWQLGEGSGGEALDGTEGRVGQQGGGGGGVPP